MKQGLSILLGFFALILNTIFFPRIHLLFFAPSLAIIFLRTPRYPSLVLAALCGLIMDLLNTEVRFGIFSLSYFSAAFIAWPQKSHFFKENPYTLSLYTAGISSLFSTIFFLLLFIFEKSFPFSWKSVITDLLLSPFIDAFYAFFWFSSPLFFYNYLFKNHKMVIRNKQRQFR